MFTTLPTALVMVAIICSIAYLAIRNYDRHHAPEQYDDRRDNADAIEQYVRVVKRKNCGKSSS